MNYDKYIENEINEIEEVEEVEENKIFVVKDLESANWAFRKLSALKQKVVEIEQVYNSEIERLDKWKNKEVSQYSNSIEYFEHLIAEYYAKEREADDRFKLSTAYGKVNAVLRTKWDYNDEVLLEELKDTDFVKEKTIYSIDKALLKKTMTVTDEGKVITEDGEVLQGVSAIKELSIKVKATEEV